MRGCALRALIIAELAFVASRVKGEVTREVRLHVCKEPSREGLSPQGG